MFLFLFVDFPLMLYCQVKHFAFCLWSILYIDFSLKCNRRILSVNACVDTIGDILLKIIPTLEEVGI